MKRDIHPEYHPEARVICACGNTWTTGSTKSEIHTDVCSACHPFFTGEQRIVDSEGHVERFIRRLERSREFQAARGEATQSDQAQTEDTASVSEE
jgi:large subunit ribosomal protein L31